MVAAALPAVNPAVLGTVDRFSTDQRLFRGVQAILAGVSGGPDSVALLLVLAELSRQRGFGLTVAHFDHQLRPDSADDLAWVAELCASLDVAFLSGEGDVRDTARRQRLGIEETARRMRYQFLSFVAGEKRIDTVATGHTADDQAETVLMHMLRGSGVRGIRGIRPVSKVPGGSQRLVRPLLCLTRDETRAICQEAGITPRHDVSNADVSFARNRVRHDLLPVLESFNPAVRSALTGLAESAASVFERVEREAMLVQPSERTAIGALFDRRQLASPGAEGLLLVIEREAAFYRTGVTANRTLLANLGSLLRGSGHGSVRLGEVEVEASGAVARVGPPLAPPTVEARVLNVPGITAAPPYRVRVLTEAPASGAPSVTIDSGLLAGALRARSPLAGDRLRWRGHNRKLSDVFQRAGVPAWDRQLALVFADSEKVHAVMAGPHSLQADVALDADPWYVTVEALPAG